MAREILTDDEVEEEIARLQGSPYVKLARREARIRYRRRQCLYTLRMLEKKGKQLEADGITTEYLDYLSCGSDELESEDIIPKA